MGLSLMVGILADLLEEDSEGAEHAVEQFRVLNDYLTSVKLPVHREPEKCEVWSADMLGYSGLHTLRRLAAHLDAGNPLPAPSDRASEDPVLEAYFQEVVEGPRGWLGRLFKASPRFRRSYDHLIVHSDAEGFYLPFDFEDVLLPPADYPVAGMMVGSVPRLLNELERIAELLKIPSRLHSQSEELWEAADSPVQDGELWQRYGTESYSCVALIEGCRHSVATGAALVFC